MPTLLYLPSLTPVDESVKLLKAAYEALFVMADVCYPQSEANTGRMKFMDRIMRRGVLQGYSHASEHFQIVEILAQEIDVLVSKMGVYAVKHLKDIIPVLSSILTEPFGGLHLSLLLTSVKTLERVILNCWPRMTQAVYRIEIIKALALCWSVVTEDDITRPAHDGKVLESVKGELRITGRMLMNSVNGKLNIMNELEPLIRADPTLTQVFYVEERSRPILT